MRTDPRTNRLAALWPVAICGCAAGCFVEFNITVAGPDGGARCGNNLAETGESCDGTDLAGQTCQGLQLGPGVLACRADCTGYETSGCTLPGCGNGVREGNELCDGPDLAGQTCVSLGYAAGDLSCDGNCTGFDTSGCARMRDGEPCTADDHCLSGTCWTEDVQGFPEGYCTGGCEGYGCPGGGICVYLIASQRLTCVSPCDSTADCRHAYMCVAQGQQEPAFCWTHCMSDADCPLTGSCNPWRGRCGWAAVGAENGAACADASDCMGAVCRTDLPQGYCTSHCALSDGFCPGDGVCADAYNGAQADLGQCYDGCENDGCTRLSYDCVASPMADGPYCWSVAPP